MTTTHEQATAAKSQEVLRIFIWQEGAAHVLHDAKFMGLREFDSGIESFLEQGKYQRLPGGIEPLETWVSDESTTRFCIIGRYDVYYHVTLVFQIATRYGYESFTQKYAAHAAALPEYMPDWQPVQAPNNLRTAYFAHGPVPGTGKYV